MGLRIGIVIEKFRPSIGGAEEYAFQLAKNLVHKGQEVHIYAEEYDQLEGFPLFFHPLQVARKPRSYHIFRFAWEASKALQKNPVDVSLGIGRVLGVDLYQPHGGVHLATLRQSYQTSPWKIHQLFRECSKLLSPKQWAFLTLERCQYQSQEILQFIALSRKVKKDMELHYHVPLSKISLIYNGVDTEKFSLLRREAYQKLVPSSLPPWKKDHFTLLFLAHNFSLKGLPCALKAFACLCKKNPSLRLLVAGKGKKTFYSLLAKWLGVEKNVFFTGPVEHPEYLYAISHALVHPTIYDPCSLVCMEALASGLPVFTTTRNGVSELMEGKGGGVLSNPHDFLSFSRQIEPLMEKDCWEKISREAHLIGQKYPLKKNTEEMMSLFQKTFDRKNGKP